MTTQGPLSRPWLYAVLFSAQLAAAGFLFWHVFPVFRAIVKNPGQQQLVAMSEHAAAIAAVIVGQFCYWFRFKRLRLPDLPENVFFEHVLLFLSRVTFIFGSALFSVVVFHHVPSFPELPGFADAMFRSGLLAAVLFTLFCFALEIENLGRAMGRRS